MEHKSHPLLTLLANTRLFPKEEAKKIYRRWLTESKGATHDVGRFAKWLLEREHLTMFQASLFSRGLTEGYFLQQYKILGRVGRGPTTGVYSAIHESGYAVAMKILPPSRAKDPELVARFQREARLALRLQHPNVVRAYHMGEADGCHFLVMEFLDGQSLEVALQRMKKLAPDVACQLVWQALQGLQHIHDMGLVHRDIKPGNLMLMPASKAGPSGVPSCMGSSRLKILDIGLVRPVSGTGQENGEPLTMAGSFLGTPYYMAPEQANDPRSVDIRSDIYSLGCVFFHALTGQPPFPDRNLMNQVVRHATEAAPRLREFDAGIPENLQQFVDRMMAKDPARRFATPAGAAKVLQPFVNADSAPPDTEVDATAQAYFQWLEKEVRLTLAEPPPETECPVPIAQSPAEARADSLAAEIQEMICEDAGLEQSEPASAELHREFEGEAKVGEGEKGRRGEGEPESGPTLPISDPSPASHPSPATLDMFALSRRDFTMLGIGGGAVLLAIFFGWLLALVLGTRGGK